jgi:tetratricopeptide (TPR) repeat protein
MKKLPLYLSISCLLLSTGVSTALANSQYLAQIDTTQEIPDTIREDKPTRSAPDTPVSNQNNQAQPNQGNTNTAPANPGTQVQNQATDITDQEQTRARERILATHTNRLRQRYQVYYQRLTNLGEKLEQRLNLLEQERQIDISAAREQLDEALIKLEQARTQGEEAIKNFEEIDPEQYQSQRQLALQARDLALQATQQFRETLQLMLNAVRSAMEQISIQQPEPTHINQ